MPAKSRAEKLQKRMEELQAAFPGGSTAREWRVMLVHLPNEGCLTCDALRKLADEEES